MDLSRFISQPAGASGEQNSKKLFQEGILEYKTLILALSEAICEDLSYLVGTVLISLFQG